MDECDLEYDYIVCGTGPSASAWVKQTLSQQKNSRILMLERGSYCKTDVLTEPNPFKLLRDSGRVIKRYEHGVVQGATLGGCTAVNNYAWITPSFKDLKSTLGVNVDTDSIGMLRSFESMAEGLLGPPQRVHPLHKLIVARFPKEFIVHNAQVKVEETNRGKVFIGRPTLSYDGQRRSAFAGLIEPLWRENFGNLDVHTDSEVSEVLFRQELGSDGEHIATGVVTAAGRKYFGKTVIVAAGALESPALLMRSGIGPAEHLAERDISLRIDNPHVGKHLRDKMLLDDMIITDNTTPLSDRSLPMVNRIYQDGVSVQLHRYDKSTIGNLYLAMTRMFRCAWDDLKLSRGLSLVAAFGNVGKFLDPAGFSALCFQTYVKMESEATVSLDTDHSAKLDAINLFDELQSRENELRSRVDDIYQSIPDMRDSSRIQYHTTSRAIQNGKIAPHFRMVWHFAGTCRVGDVVDPTNFAVYGTRGLHVVDMSACQECPDGGSMAMAYMTGHIAASHMYREMIRCASIDSKSSTETNSASSTQSS